MDHFFFGGGEGGGEFNSQKYCMINCPDKFMWIESFFLSRSEEVNYYTY